MRDEDSQATPYQKKLAHKEFLPGCYGQNKACERPSRTN